MSSESSPLLALAEPTPKCVLTPVDQNRFGRGEGNCFAACLASLTGIDLELLTVQLGHGGGTWHENGEWSPNPEEEHWYDRAARVMRSHGYEIHYDTTEGPDDYALRSGMSPRGLNHSTIWRDGVMVHDPHPSRAGTDAPIDWIWLTPSEVPRD